jgi:hypothetical protein
MAGKFFYQCIGFFIIWLTPQIDQVMDASFPHGDFSG